RPPDFLARATAVPADRFQHAIAAFETGDGRLGENLDVRKARNTVDEIPRHARGEVVSANENPYFLDLGRQINDRLSRRIARAYQRDLLAGAQLGLERRSPVMDACAEIRLDALDGKLPVARAACDHDRTGPGIFIVGEPQHERTSRQIG